MWPSLGSRVLCAKNEYFKFKKMEFLFLTNFKLFNRIKGNSANNQNYIQFVISFRGGHFDYAPGRLKT
jgi:hypothetical protein